MNLQEEQNQTWFDSIKWSKIQKQTLSFIMKIQDQTIGEKCSSHCAISTQLFENDENMDLLVGT